MISINLKQWNQRSNRTPRSNDLHRSSPRLCGKSGAQDHGKTHGLDVGTWKNWLGHSMIQNTSNHDRTNHTYDNDRNLIVGHQIATDCMCICKYIYIYLYICISDGSSDIHCMVATSLSAPKLSSRPAGPRSQTSLGSSHNTCAVVPPSWWSSWCFPNLFLGQNKGLIHMFKAHVAMTFGNTLEQNGRIRYIPTMQ